MNTKIKKLLSKSSKENMPSEALFKPLISGKRNMWIFVFSAIIIPIILHLLITPLYNLKNVGDYSYLIYLILTLISMWVGYNSINPRNGWKLLSFSRGSTLYWFFAINIIISVVAGPILSLVTKDTLTLNIIVTYIQAIVEFIFGILVIIKNDDLKKRIMNALKNNYIYLIVIIIIATGIGFALQYAMSDVSSLINKGSTSANQENLNSLFKSTSGIIGLFLLTVIGAPLFEELSFRESIFSLTPNKNIALIASICLFATVHIQGGFADWANIFPYLAGGVTLAGVYYYSKNNLIFSIGTHISLNLITFILGVTGAN